MFALILASLGIYAPISYSVNQRAGDRDASARSVLLLLLVQGDDIDGLSFEVRALGRSRPCFPISRHDDGRGRHDFPILFADDSDRPRVHPRKSRGITPRTVAGDGNVFPVVVSGEHPVTHRTIRAHEVNGKPDALAYCLYCGAAAFRAF